jgi:GST-like protein
MEAKRQLDVLDRRLADNRYMCGDEYTIADIAIWPWYGGVLLNRVYDAAEFLDADSYTHVMRWTKDIDSRETVRRGRMVNRARGALHEQLRERHDASDFTTRTQDKIEAAS